LFELSFIKKILTPKRRQLSTSLIALLSVTVITLVVWLVTVFLSVTEGIERGWLKKLTALNAPLRLQPTEEYYASYYYNVDQYSLASQYLSKTLGQKAQSLISDPYDPEIDQELPKGIALPDLEDGGRLKDPVKGAIAALESLRKDFPSLAFQDVQLSGALLRLDLIRQDRNSAVPSDHRSQLTHVSYLASFPEKNPNLSELIVPPTADDLNHLLYLSSSPFQEGQTWDALLEHVQIQTVKPRSDLWRISLHLLPEKTPFRVGAYLHKGEVSHLVVPSAKAGGPSTFIERRGDHLFFWGEDFPEQPLEDGVPLFAQGVQELNVTHQIAEAVAVEGKIQNHGISGEIPLSELLIVDASFKTHFDQSPSSAPIWPYFGKDAQAVLPSVSSCTGILLPKHFQKNGVKIGDRGHLAYSAPTLSGIQEQHLPVYVAGFYDPGIMAVGNKCILVPPQITEAINASESGFTLEPSEANNVFVWLRSINDAPKVKTALLDALQKKGIDKYWQVKTFREYDFAKDLMLQFQSDKYLYTLIGIIILLVGCTNIISLLVLLVSDKKKEIGILRAMGAKKRSIAAIFAFSGATLGVLSCLLGVLFAYLTLRNIDVVVQFLSLVQGHEAFNAQFFGTSLPRELTGRALLFAAIATPVLALLAGLVPAIKAARLNPSTTLRGE